MRSYCHSPARGLSDTILHSEYSAAPKRTTTTGRYYRHTRAFHVHVHPRTRYLSCGNIRVRARARLHTCPHQLLAVPRRRRAHNLTARSTKLAPFTSASVPTPVPVTVSILAFVSMPVPAVAPTSTSAVCSATRAASPQNHHRHHIHAFYHVCFRPPVAVPVFVSVHPHAHARASARTRAQYLLCQARVDLTPLLSPPLFVFEFFGLRLDHCISLYRFKNWRMHDWPVKNLIWEKTCLLWKHRPRTASLSNE
jgi:hypothetical protein